MAKFVPVQKTKTDEEGNIKEIGLYRGTTLEEIVSFLNENGTDKDKKTFKENCYYRVVKKGTGKYIQSGKNKGKEILEPATDKDGKVILERTKDFNWLYAKQKFFEEFAPEYLPNTEPKKKMKDIIDLW